MSAITMDEWFAEIQRLQAGAASDDEGMTIDEIKDHLRVGKETARQLLRQAHTQGRLAVGRRHITRIDNRPSVIPVYRITEAKQ